MYKSLDKSAPTMMGKIAYLGEQLAGAYSDIGRRANQVQVDGDAA
jgi:hypothetical protein